MHIIFLSSGITSWVAGLRTVERYGKGNCIGVFADTGVEDPDNYRFLDESTAVLGIPLVRVQRETLWENWDRHNAIPNNRMAFCSQQLKQEPCRKWLKENSDPKNDTLCVGIAWDEIHRIPAIEKGWSPWPVEFPMVDPPYLDKPQTLQMAIDRGIEPPRLYRYGLPHANCFAGHTKFLTSKGFKTLEECAGQSIKVLGHHARWVDATVQKFGVQETMKVTISRHGVSKEIYATPDHVWFKWKGNRCDQKIDVFTKDLCEGDRLVTQYPPGVSKSIEYSPWGIAHGFVFGDGCASNHHKGWNTCGRVRLCGEKDMSMLRYFPLSPKSETENGDIVVSGIPRFFKELPLLTETKSYLVGWLAGYFAADGSVSKDAATIKLSSSVLSNLEFAKNVASMLGIATGEITCQMRKGFNDFPTELYTLPFFQQTLDDRFFILDKHKNRFATRMEKLAERLRKPRSKASRSSVSWTVQSVEHTGKSEPVYCAIVPDGNAFTIDGHVFVHNCGGGCVRAGIGQWKHVLRVLPDVYALWERKEQEMQERTGKNCTILKRSIRGQSQPFSLKELREQQESQGSLFDDDWGGCGCFSDF